LTVERLALADVCNEAQVLGRRVLERDGRGPLFMRFQCAATSVGEDRVELFRRGPFGVAAGRPSTTPTGRQTPT
jgi:hypothetical protein